MPTYEYACDACGHQWEASQSIKDDPLKKCPSCKKMKAKRQISAGTGFILKGGGWYSDLYASSSSKKSDSSTSESATSSTSSTSSDAKSDTSSKSKKSESKSSSSSD